MAPAVATYEPRDPSRTVLYKVIAEHLETFLASFDADPDAKGLSAYVQREFYDYLQCGILAHGFLRLGCDTCHHELLVPFSCKRRGFCPSCAGRRMTQMAAHLVEQVIPWVPTRQWVVSVPIPLRYWTAPWQLRSSNASLVANEPASPCAASARVLALRARRPGSLVLAVPVSTGFPSTPTRRFQRIGAISWSVCSAIPPVGPCPWSASRKTPTAIWSTRSR